MLLRQVLESLEEHVETDRYICSAFDLAGRLSNMICTRAYDLGNSVPISEQVTLTSSVLYPYPCAEVLKRYASTVHELPGHNLTAHSTRPRRCH